MQARTARRLIVVATLVVAMVGVGTGVAPGAAAATRWAPEATATIHPGVQTETAGGQCTADFVFYRGADLYLGQAAHCAGTGAATDTNGCAAGSLPLGIPVLIEGATRPGTLVYSSWLTMQASGERNPDVCAYNDFALVRIDPADRGRVNPTVPHWGGPMGINKTGIASFGPVFTLGNSSLRQGIDLLKPKSGFSLGTAGGGWVHPTYTLTPGIPGDSGSAMIDAFGLAAGVLSTIELLPLPASNAYSDLSRVLNYARDHGMGDVRLARGTRAFNPAQLPLGL